MRQDPGVRGFEGHEASETLRIRPAVMHIREALMCPVNPDGVLRRRLTGAYSVTSSYQYIQPKT